MTAEITDITERLRAAPRTVKADDLVAEIKRMLGDQQISAIYRDRIRSIRTRSYKLNGSTRKVEVEVMHTLLGVELKLGKRRLLCPDLATARYLAVFGRRGVAETAVPYDITQISRLADDLESSWFRMLMLAEHLTAGRSERLRNRVIAGLVADQRQEVAALGAGPAIPEFNQNTKQRRPRN
ncbi:MAG TPA: hypothetical protein PLD20_17335 [Blastocatellia bacterium]|nr:hypothetical protein [Blastocatellia bacterium]